MAKHFTFILIDSTSAYLLRRRFEIKNFTVCRALYQTKGHGRRGRTWASSFGQNLLFSIFMNDPSVVPQYSSLSLLSAVCVSKVLEQYGIQDVQIKWPNDVYIKGKKICGILLESISDQGALSSLVIGMGINVNQKYFKGEYKQQPTSLYLETGVHVSISKMQKEIELQLEKELANLKNGTSEYQDYVKTHLYYRNEKVIIEEHGTPLEVEILDVAQDDGLIVLTKEGPKTIYSGEVTFHI